MIDPYKIKYYETEVKTFWQTHKNEIFLIGGIALLVICLSIYYVKCGNDIPVKGITKPDVIIKKEVQKVVDSKKVDSLEKVIAQVTNDKLSVEGKLKAAQESNRKLAAAIPSNQASNQATDHTQDDYIKRLEDHIQKQEDGAYTSDSLCNEVQKQWVDLSELKDSTIKVLKSDKRILISSFNDLGYNSTMKDKAIKDLNRSLRWQKVQKYALLGALGYVAFKTLTK